MVTRKTRTFGVVVPDITNPFFSGLVHAIESAAIHRGYTTVVCSSERDADHEAHCLDVLLDKRVDTLIYAAGQVKPNSRLAGFVDYGTPIISVDQDLGHLPSACAVLVDNYGGGALAAKHLIELGHTSVGVVAGPKQLSTTMTRLKGFREVFSKCGYPVLRSQVTHARGFDIGSGVRAAERLLTSNDAITAVFCENDLIAFGLYQVAQQHGWRIPERLSVVGFDDIFVASFVAPALTTIRQPLTRIGIEVIDLAINAVEASIETQVVRVLPVTLVVRDSTRQLRLARTGLS
jgi:LacI family transcriptional regulator